MSLSVVSRLINSDSINGAIYTAIISTKMKAKIDSYQHLFYYYLLYTGVALYVLTFPRSSSGESQEYQSKCTTHNRMHTIKIINTEQTQV
jgi:hypothetical protein